MVNILRKQKICNNCKQLKSITEFYKYKTSKDGLRSQCKDCMTRGDRERYQKNPEHQKKYDKEYYEINKDKILKQKQEYYKANRDKILGRQRKHYKTNKDKFSEKRKNIKYRFNHSISCAIYRSLKGNKAGCHWESLVEYTLEDLKKHLEKQFKDGMTWDNYGKNGWVIDHRIPFSVHNFDLPEHMDFKRCWALQNLQPLWASENTSKHNKLNQAFQPSFKL